MLERLAGYEYYCFLNGFSGYFQIPIALEDQEKTTFTCPYGTFAYKRMPFGLCNAPTTFQRCMIAIFYELIEDSIECIQDDFSVFGSSFDRYLKNLEKMLKRNEYDGVLASESVGFDVSTDIKRIILATLLLKSSISKSIPYASEFDKSISKLQQFFENPSFKADYCGGTHEADECEQNNPSEQVCLSGGDINNDPSLLRFYQNNDTSP
ncbi:RNA-directed DNA polymerase [Tanacetum coccineum]